MVSADQIKEHIVRHLKWDDSLKDSQIKVDYIGRVAVLEGTVPNLAAHAATQRDALNIPGVERVENRLVVKYTHGHPDKTDKEITEAVRSVLECTVGQANGIEISAIDGTVMLKGTVDSFWLKGRIEDLAASVEGILQIKNEIKVKRSEKAPDNAIKKEITSALQRMEVDGLENIKVEVKDGVVTFSGTVPTWETVFDLEDTAKFTSGVTDVKSKLTVE